MYLKRHLFKNDCVHCIYNRAAPKGGLGHAYQNTGSYWREYTVKTLLRIGD